MWDSADQYLEDKRILWKKGEELMKEIETNPKYKDLLDIIPFIVDIKEDRHFFEKYKDAYFEKMHKYKIQRDVYKIYSQQLERATRGRYENTIRILRNQCKIDNIEHEIEEER